MEALVVITTVGTEKQANLIAEELVGRRQAACVNILRIPRTVYRWQGKVLRDSELMLIIKTSEEEFADVERTIKELHDYEVAEILGFPASRGSSEFLAWIAGSLDKQAAFPDENDEASSSAPAETDD